jgi:hypothetical protein
MSLEREIINLISTHKIPGQQGFNFITQIVRGYNHTIVTVLNALAVEELNLLND